ncbi:uncharacterized protein LOC110862067 isoform X2 [Folsomia candida]|uniref:uncharacterized protein LOC110862067 isoform X2 n=1 Tax=Folsomia candida TaxID=158441 RepID=UPI000B908C55|nr:uncharacterized protein LOC110862067 isoform X2 [Folsomia candida]
MDNRNIGGGRMMTSWAARMHRGAASLGTVVTSCGHPSAPYPRRIDKVKFGVPLEEVCKNDIPGPLLILILKLNKEAPYKKDVFRAPGHQGSMKKLIHFLQNGRLVNIDNFSVYTIASVLKKFLRKIPDGIFGRDGEAQLFHIIDMTSVEHQRDHIHALISTLPIYTQRLIVLLFGTFRVIASNCERAQTGMTSEALGVSVAPSFFQSCVSDGKQAKMEDVMKFKVATKIMKFLIDNFGVSNLFGRDNYEYYARITGRILRVEEDWIFSFRYPPDALVSHQLSLEAEKHWLQYESDRWGLKFNLEAMSQQEESHSTPALMQVLDRLDAETAEANSSLNSIPENSLLESYTRLSISLEDNGLFNGVSVHERQVARMKTRSEWFLSPVICSGMTCVDVDGPATPFYILKEDTGRNLEASGQGSGSQESLKQHQLVRRSSSKDKDRRLVRRSSSKKNKENGTTSTSATTANRKQTGSSSGTSSNPAVNNNSSPSGEVIGHVVGGGGAGAEACGGSTTTPTTPVSSKGVGNSPSRNPVAGCSQAESVPGETTCESDYLTNMVLEADCTETDVQSFHVTLTYKPRI